MTIVNQSKNTTLADTAKIADSFIARFVGLLNRSSLAAGEALLIMRCNAIHMFFMRFAIDAIFIDRNNVVVGVTRNLRPFRISRIFWNATSVIELPAGTIDVSRTEIGDQLATHP